MRPAAPILVSTVCGKHATQHSSSCLEQVPVAEDVETLGPETPLLTRINVKFRNQNCPLKPDFKYD